jgi:hypothetical protein
MNRLEARTVFKVPGQRVYDRRRGMAALQLREHVRDRRTPRLARLARRHLVLFFGGKII